jgi:excisionase family DNA binding protein
MNGEVTRLIDAEALGELLSLPPASVRRLAREGKLPVLHVGRLLRFDLARVLEALEAKQEGVTGD